MSGEERYEIAKAYVDKQLQNMKENGLAVKQLSTQEYDSMVKQIAQTVKSAATSSTSQT